MHQKFKFDNLFRISDYTIYDSRNCFLRIASKASSGFNKIYTQHLNGYDKATCKISFFPDECFVRKWLKFQVSKYRLRWNAENRTSSFMSHPKKITQLPFLRALYDWKSTSLLNYYYIRPHLDARCFFLYGVLPPPQIRLKLFLFTPVFLDK